MLERRWGWPVPNGSFAEQRNKQQTIQTTTDVQSVKLCYILFTVIQYK